MANVWVDQAGLSLIMMDEKLGESIFRVIQVWEREKVEERERVCQSLIPITLHYHHI